MRNFFYSYHHWFLFFHSNRCPGKNEGRVYIIGFSGDYITPVSVERVNGLKQVVSEYLNVDFADSGTRLQYKIFSALHSKNISLFLNQFKNRNWGKIDCTCFSKALNPEIEHYQFDIESILAGESIHTRH